MARRADLELDRGLAADLDRLADDLRGRAILPSTRSAGARLRVVDLLHVEVLRVRPEVAHAPADVPVVPEHEERHAGEREADPGEAAAVQAVLVPGRRQIRPDVHVVGEQRLAARRAAPVDDPVVAAGHDVRDRRGRGRASVEAVHRGDPGEAPWTAAAAPAGGRHDEGRLRRVGRKQEVGEALAGLGDHGGAQELDAVVPAEAEREHVADGEGGERGPARGREAEDGELEGEGIGAVEARVDALRVGFEHGALPRVELRPRALGDAAEPEGAREAVHGDRGGAERGACMVPPRRHGG